ncbi:MAG: GNAT family N-acetyltransferase [Chloroflexi bacterium]|nr:GNAT family N-acetyltransferase [Chloroflexota bacterium]
MLILTSEASERACTERDPHALATVWSALAASRARPSIFLTPEWLSVARAHDPNTALTLAVGESGIIAASRGADGTVRFGGGDLTDEHDILAAAGTERQVAEAFARWLAANAARVDLEFVPEDVPTLDVVAETLGAAGFTVERSRQVTAPRLPLNGDFDAYVQSLDKKERHELRRKMRRLESAGAARFRFASDAERPAVLDRFFALHRLSRGDKAEFMTEANEHFFRDIAEALAPLGRLRLGVVSLDGADVAVLFAFAYAGTLALYNAAYDPGLASLSIGIASHAWAIRAATLEGGFHTYDLLRGDEPYKYDLGAKDLWLERLVAVRA